MMEPPLVIGLPHHRVVVALDIERSTSRPDPVKAYLRNKIYELFDTALFSARIQKRHRDRFIDRGDGILALIHPVDRAPKALMLNSVIPVFSQLLHDHNASLPLHNKQQQLRVRTVMHAGEVNYDVNGCFGETLDIAFRLLDAAEVKRTLRMTTDSLTVVVSEDIYRSVVRHGYNGIDQSAFYPLVSIQIAGRRHKGWIYIPRQTSQHDVTEMISYQRTALPAYKATPASCICWRPRNARASPALGTSLSAAG